MILALLLAVNLYAFTPCENLRDKIKLNMTYGETPQYFDFRGKNIWMPYFLVKKYGRNLYVNDHGFIDFSPWAVKQVRIRMTGDRNLDKEIANQKVFYSPYKPESYRRYVWHHSEDMTTMYLIPKDLHEAVPHRGGFSYNKRKWNENTK